MKTKSAAFSIPDAVCPQVLIAEDNEDKRALLKRILDQSYRVLEAEDGTAALSLVGEWQPDVVLLDVLMPGLDGFEVCRRMKADPRTADIPVLFVSVLDPDQHVVEGLTLGGEDFISWPVNSSELLARIQARIRLYRPMNELRMVVRQQSLRLEEDRRQLAVTELELEHARKVQQRFVTGSFPDGSSVRFSHKYRPSGKVGGDMLDIVAIRKSEVGIMVADVSGHGVAAALLAGVAKVLFRIGAEQYQDPGLLLNWFNRQISSYLVTGEFLTVFIGFWNSIDYRLSYAGAGHPPALLLTTREQSVERLYANPGIIGLRADATFTGSCVRLKEGQRVVFYTDGLTDAMNSHSELFGEDRLIEACSRFTTVPIERMVENVFEDVDRFTETKNQLDDQALLVLEVSA
jgi:sigma-B regulation protein RsbU (phosphoserine phosphatase)